MKYPWNNINCESGKNCKAVYKIRLVNNLKNPKSIQRFLGKDKEGILMIGQTNDMENRLQKFKQAFAKGEAHHSEGKLLHIIVATIEHPRLKIGVKDIEYCFESFTNIEAAKKSEEKSLKSYVKKYGEAPPLNSIIPHRDTARFWK